MGTPDRVRGPGLGDRGLEGDLDAVAVQPLDDLPSAADALFLGAIAGGGDRVEVDPVAEHVQIVRVPVDARHLDRRHALDSRLVAASIASGTPATASWSVSDITVTPASAAASPRPTARAARPIRSSAPEGQSSVRAANCRRDRAPDEPEMRISAKADYAVRAALELAASPDKEPIKGEQLSEAQEIPLQFLEHILLELKHARLVRARRGARGGYWLARPAGGDHPRRRDPGGRGAAGQHPGLGARGDQLPGAAPSTCATSGSRSAPTCGTCWSSVTLADLAAASCREPVARADRRPGRLASPLARPELQSRTGAAASGAGATLFARPS